MSTGELNLTKMERLVRELCELKNQGKDVILVSSGAIAVGKKVMNIAPTDKEVPIKQACAAVGQARLMMIYQRSRPMPTESGLLHQRSTAPG